MPTVSNHDILGPMAWGSNMRQESNGGDMGLLEGASNFTSSCSHLVGDEHAYATGGIPRFVSSNGYYGFHPATADAVTRDCSMDTSENNLPLGQLPSSGAGAFGGMDVLNAEPTVWNQNQTRKRNFGSDHDMSERAMKRSRCSASGGMEQEVSTLAMAHSYGMHTSTDQSHSPAQTFDLPTQQLPGSSAHFMDAMTPRPRCLLGHFI